MLQAQQQEYKIVSTSRNASTCRNFAPTYWRFSINWLESLKFVRMDGIQHDAPHAMGDQQLDIINTDINAESPTTQSDNQTKELLGSSEDVMFRVQTWLPARPLVRMALVCKQWRNWQRSILTDENYFQRGFRPSYSVLQDWYFPTTLCTRMRIKPPTLQWAGVHHSTGLQFQKLPDITFVPVPPEVYHTVSSAGGLLWLQQGEVDSNNYIVCNPLTKKWKRLPPCPAPRMMFARPLEHMLIDESSESYKLYVISENYVCEYTSAGQEWSPVWWFERPRTSRCVYSSIITEGFVYSLEEVGYRHSVVEVFDIHAKLWRSDMIYTLFDERMHHQIFEGNETYSPSLVVCWGAIYAIVPVEVEGFEHDRRRPFFCTTVGFHIFKLQKQTGSFEFQSKLPVETRVDAPASLDLAGLAPHNWYSCNSNQNVIWLACGCHLIQYDVISELWKSVVREHSCELGSFPFEPNFRANP